MKEFLFLRRFPLRKTQHIINLQTKVFLNAKLFLLLPLTHPLPPHHVLLTFVGHSCGELWLRINYPNANVPLQTKTHKCRRCEGLRPPLPRQGGLMPHVYNEDILESTVRVSSRFPSSIIISFSSKQHNVIFHYS